MTFQAGSFFGPNGQPWHEQKVPLFDDCATVSSSMVTSASKVVCMEKFSTLASGYLFYKALCELPSCGVSSPWPAQHTDTPMFKADTGVLMITNQVRLVGGCFGSGLKNYFSTAPS